MAYSSEIVRKARQQLAQKKADRESQILQRLQEAAEGCVKLVTVAPEQPGAMEFMQAIHGKMKIALVSNGVSAIQHGRLSRCAFTPMLDAVIISEELGVSKPDPAMVYAALEQLGCTDKSEAVLLGDSLSADIPAAINAGVDSIFLNLKGKETSLPTYSAATLEEVLAILMQ